jgi:cytochrome P450
MHDLLEGAPLHPCPPLRTIGPTSAPLWYVSRNADVRAVLACPFASSDPSRPGFPEQEDLTGRTPFLIELDAPRHAQLRRLVLPEFGSRSINALAPRIEASALRLIDAMRESGSTAPLAEDFARPLASLAICHLLDVPEYDGPWLTSIAAILADDSAGAEAQGAAFAAISTYMETLIDARIALPGSDLLLMAGHDTSARMIELGVKTLLDERHAVVRLVESRQVALAAVDELVRLHSIADDDSVRVATADFEIAGVKIAPGDGIVPLIRHANHDPAAFDRPYLFDLDRNTNAQVGFGYGPHLCLGRPLARLTLAIAFQSLFAAIPGLRRASHRGDPLIVAGW